MQGIKDLQLYVQVLMITSNIHSNCKFLFCRVLHVQHAFFSFTPANKSVTFSSCSRCWYQSSHCFCLSHQCLHYDWSVSSIVLNREIPFMISWCNYPHDLRNEKYKSVRQTLPPLFLQLSSHLSSVQLIFSHITIQTKQFQDSWICRQFFLNLTLKKQSSA